MEFKDETLKDIKLGMHPVVIIPLDEGSAQRLQDFLTGASNEDGDRFYAMIPPHDHGKE